MAEKFLKKYKLLYLIRSHECKPEGYELTHGSKVQHTKQITNYCERWSWANSAKQDGRQGTAVAKSINTK